MNTQNQKVIIVKDGIFTIKQDLQTGTVKQDPSLKALVEAVLH